MSKVSILRTAEYTPQCLDSAVEEHFRLLGLDRVLRPGLRVVVKPNLLMRRAPDEATTTHPEAVAAVVRALKRRGVADITLADSPGGPYSAALMAPLYKAAGMAEIAGREGIRLHMGTGWKTVPAAETARLVKEFNLIDPVADADLVVNLCKLKTHCMTGLSGAVKNLFGCVPGLQKAEFHYRFKAPDDFCNLLVDLCETVRPAFTFVDAVVGMEGDGPSGGSPKPLGLTLCSQNPYDLDEVLARLIGLPRGRALTVKAAAARGLASPWEGIGLEGEPGLLDSVRDFQLPRSAAVDFNTRVPKPLRGLADRFTDRFITPRPVVDRAKCVGCGRCAETCPAHTITLKGGKARIRPGACIRCCCCHELCPVKAIDLRAAVLFHNH